MVYYERRVGCDWDRGGDPKPCSEARFKYRMERFITHDVLSPFSDLGKNRSVSINAGERCLQSGSMLEIGRGVFDENWLMIKGDLCRRTAGRIHKELEVAKLKNDLPISKENLSRSSVQEAPFIAV